jgi:hypothetical protein
VSQAPISPEQRLWELQALTYSCAQDSSCVSMPAYFRFLTLMAFHVFLQEKVRALPRPRYLTPQGLESQQGGLPAPSWHPGTHFPLTCHLVFCRSTWQW